MSIEISGLPGADLIAQGLKDLRASKFTVPSLLICIARTRLQSAGLDIPKLAVYPSEPEFQLYDLLRQDQSIDVYSQYNSLIRQLISFESALEQRASSLAKL